MNFFDITPDGSPFDLDNPAHVKHAEQAITDISAMAALLENYVTLSSDPIEGEAFKAACEAMPNDAEAFITAVAPLLDEAMSRIRERQPATAG